MHSCSHDLKILTQAEMSDIDLGVKVGVAVWLFGFTDWYLCTCNGMQGISLAV